MQKIQVLFPAPVMARLRSLSEEEDRPVSELVRRAVERFLEVKPLPPSRSGKLPVFSAGPVLVRAGALKAAIYDEDAV